MVTMKKKKQACQSAPGSVDLISNLFEDVLNLILVRLPIRDVVRTSILSRKWRYKWISISDLVFDKDCLMEGASKAEHVHVVDQVLVHHVGPICKFSCMFYVPSCSHIDRWIVFLSRNGIKKLTLMTKGRRDYDVPSSIFYCQELSHLELVNCVLKVPSTFKGFHKLLVLNLCVSISEDAIALLISKCPLLERLKLKTEALYQCLNIHAPNLRYFEFSGQFRDLKLGNSPLLTNVSMDSFEAPSDWHILDQRNTCSLVQFTNYSCRVERLALKGCSLQYFLLGDVPEKLPVTYDHLKYLEVHIEWNSKEILATLCILRSAPNLKELKISYVLNDVDMRCDLSREEAEFWGAKIQFDCMLNHLQAVEIIGPALSMDLQFIEYILSHAPVLETIEVYTDEYLKDKEVMRIMKELMRFRRASRQAEIRYLGHYKEMVESWRGS